MHFCGVIREKKRIKILNKGHGIVRKRSEKFNDDVLMLVWVRAIT